MEKINTEVLFSRILGKIQNGAYNDYELWNALYVIVRDMENTKEKWNITAKLKSALSFTLKKEDLAIKEQLEEIFRETLLIEARGIRFDSYMQYLELAREPEKKFWLPRRKQLLFVCQAIQKLIDDELDILTISLPPGTGKALADDTPILTKYGWKTHGELVAGDYVVSPEGKFVKVIAVHPKCEMQYKITFSNNEEIICHGNHEWYIYNRHRMKYENLSTECMFNSGVESGVSGKRGHRYHYQIPLRQPLDCNDKELYVDPYALGVWLGDGRNNNPDICGDKTDYAIVERITAHYPMSWHTTHKTTGVEYYGFKSLRKGLQSYGLCHSRQRVDKFIPDDYFTASKRQRLYLLAGLLDTDGCKLPDKNGYSFTTAEKTLKDSFVKLVSTFGWRCSVRYNPPKTSTSGIYGRRGHYTIRFMPTEYIPCALPRKQLNEFSKQRKIAISKIEKINGVRGNCITVEGGLYCAGDTMLTTHNSTLEIFLHSMLIGANPDKPSLASGHSGTLTNSIYEGVLNIINDGEEYLWRDIFPKAGNVITNAKEQTIDIGKKHRFSSLTCRAIGASLTGATRCEQFLTADDLVSGIEEALSAPRMDKLWQLYTNDLKSRKKMGCKELHLATRWSVHDPIGRLQVMYEGNSRFMSIVVPATDEKGRSNFNYAYGVGFDENYFKDMEENYDDASYQALFMNQPIEREGLLYSPDTLKRYYDRPAGEPDAILGVCDTKDRGKDYCVLPVAYVYGQNFYIEDVICDNSLPEIVDSRLVEIICKHNVQQVRFESNSAGGRIARDTQNALRERGQRCSVSTKFSTATKETKIIVNSNWVKDHCYFKESDTYTKKSDYGRFMTMLCSYTQVGKNPHDDVPDAMAMLAEFVQSLSLARVEVFQRPW